MIKPGRSIALWELDAIKASFTADCVKVAVPALFEMPSFRNLPIIQAKSLNSVESCV